MHSGEQKKIIRHSWGHTSVHNRHLVFFSFKISIRLFFATANKENYTLWKQYFDPKGQKELLSEPRPRGDIPSPTVNKGFNRLRASSVTLENWIVLRNLHRVYRGSIEGESKSASGGKKKRGICETLAADDYRLSATFAAKETDTRSIKKKSLSDSVNPH